MSWTSSSLREGGLKLSENNNLDSGLRVRSIENQAYITLVER